MRFLPLLTIMLPLAIVSACSNQRERNLQGGPDEVDLNQSVTNGRPLDPVFKDFDKNWRKFISDSPQLRVAVVGTPLPEAKVQEPIVTSECIYSAGARGYVPKVTIIWNDNQPSNPILSRAAQQGGAGTSTVRFDLGLVHDAFGRNFFTSALSTDKAKRFSLPTDSALIKNQDAVLLAGPSLFPNLVDYHAELLQDQSTNRQFLRSLVVLGELGPGLTYNLRVSRLADNKWNSERQFVFMSPVCPNEL